MHRLTGLDLDGWHDLAVRDTPHEGSEAEIDNAGEEPSHYVIDGGIGGIVVQFRDEEKKLTTDFMGGPQALASAIGRGEGWGEIGRKNRRHSVKELLISVLTNRQDDAMDADTLLRAAADALTSQTDEVIATIPDHSEIDDECQERLIKALRRRGLKVTLLWHPVAIVLHAIKEGILNEAHIDMPVLIVRHVTDGFHLQTLTLRRLQSHAGIIAPERADAGQHVVAQCGLSGLLAQAQNVLRAANHDFEFERHDDSRLPLRLLLDDVECEKVEILRSLNGLWSEIKPVPRQAFHPELTIPQLDWGKAKTVLLSTPLAAPFRHELKKVLEVASGKNVILMTLDAAARGAVIAGRRIESGIPHYLDRLEQVSLIILRNNEVVPEDLVPDNSVVAANREFVAHPVTLGWPARQRTMEFYLRKGGVFKKWITADVDPADDIQAVEVQLRQMPAQGRARVGITSRDWDILRSRPIHLDWSTLEPVDLSFEEIAEKLKPRPVVPERVTARAHIIHWTGADRLLAFEPFILRCDPNNSSDLIQLGKMLQRQWPVPNEATIEDAPKYITTRLLDYDGQPPVGVNPDALAALDRVLAMIGKMIIDNCDPKKGFSDNNLSKVATWSFGRCPDGVQNAVLDAVKSHFTSRQHPLLAPRASSTLLIHGLGRIIIDPARLGEAIDLLLENWTKGNAIAALASLLSRPVATPQVLTIDRTHHIAIIAEQSLYDLLDKASYGNKLTYALRLIGGLLRSREVSPFELILSNSTEAARLHTALTSVHHEIEKHRKHIQRPERRLELIDGLLNLLEGTGGNAGILVDLDELDNIENDNSD